MPKSRKRKKKPQASTRTVKMTPRVEEALKRQFEAFREKFGRDPGPGDPVFFDVDGVEPAPRDYQEEILAAMQQANLPPEFSYAYKKTGLLGLAEDKSAWPAEHVEEWNAAVDEYRAIEEASKQPGRPKPGAWNTQIPELLASPFTQENLDQVHECLRAIAPIEARGMTVMTQIELTAHLVAAACAHAYQATEANNESEYGPDLFDLTEELIIRRAREIYAEGD